MNTPEEDDRLLEEVLNAWRPDRVAGLNAHEAWFDLSEEARRAAYEATLWLREMEAALDGDGHSSTVARVLDMLPG